MKISTARLKNIIHEETYKRYTMVHEIRQMGDELLEDVEKGLLEDMMSQPTFDAKVAWVKTNKPKIKNPEGYVAAAMRKAGEIKETKMKISKTRLQQIIQEELSSLQEGYDHEADADEAFIQSSALGRADAKDDQEAGRSKGDKGAQANRRDADSDKDYVRAYEAALRSTKGKLEEAIPGAGLVSQFISFIQQNPEVAVAAISANAAALGIAELLESLANKVRQGLANRERDVQKEAEHADEKGDDEDALVLKDPPDIKRMKQGLKRISRPRSAGDFRSDKERFKKP